MSGCSLLERISEINHIRMETYNKNASPPRLNHALAPPNINPVGPGPGGGGGMGVMGNGDIGGGKGLPNGILHGVEQLMGELGVGVSQLPAGAVPPPQPQPQQPPGPGPLSQPPQQQAVLEKDYYGCFCLKFIVKNGSHITEDKVQEDFGHFGEVVDVRGPGLFSGLRGNHVYVRFIDKADAEDALRQLSAKYHQLTPASISDVLPDNYGLYTISFYNKTGIPSAEVRKEFSQFGEVKNLTGSLDVKGGRVFVSYKDKTSAVQALQAFFFRKERYPNMKFALPRCEKDYFGCYCLKFYNKSGDVTEEKVLRDFGQFGEVVDVRGPGLFDVTGDDVYVRYKEKTSAEQALIELVGKYDSLCLAPPSDIQADKFGYFTITFVNDKCLSKSDVWYIFSKFGTVACVNGTFDCKKGRVFVSYKDKQGALNALETMLITKEYHLQVSKNSTVRKNDYNVVGGNVKDSIEGNDYGDFTALAGNNGMSHVARNNSDGAINGKTNNIPNSLSSMVAASLQHQAFMKDPELLQKIQQHQHAPRDHSRSRESSLVPCGPPHARAPSVPSINATGSGLNPAAAAAALAAAAAVGGSAPPAPGTATGSGVVNPSALQSQPVLPQLPSHPSISSSGVSSLSGGLDQQSSLQQQQQGRSNGLVKFNRNVGKDIFGYYCLSFLNEDGDINEKKVRHDFGKFGEVVSVRGALGKQKGHVFVRFRRKESAENCLNCLNSFPLSEMSELFGKYLFLSPATPRDIDCDMYGFYSISFLNLNMKTFREIRAEFAKFGDIVRLTSGGGGNTDELVSISYKEKPAAVRALQTHFTNKEFPYLDIAKGSSLLLVTSSDSSDNEDGGTEADFNGAGSRTLAHLNHHHSAASMQPHHPHQSQHQRDQGPPAPNHHQLDQHQMPPISGGSTSSAQSDPFHDPRPAVQNGVAGPSDVVDELLKPLQSYFNIYRTGQYQSILGSESNGGGPSGLDGVSGGFGPLINGQPRSPDKKYRIKSVKPSTSNGHSSPSNSASKHLPRGSGNGASDGGPPLHLPPPNHSAFSVPPPPTAVLPNGSGITAPPPPPSNMAAVTSLPPPSLSTISTGVDQQHCVPPPPMDMTSAPIVSSSPTEADSGSSALSQQQPESPEKELSLPCNGLSVTPSSKESSSSPERESETSDESIARSVLRVTESEGECDSGAGDVDSAPKSDESPTDDNSDALSKSTGAVHEDYLGYFSLSFSNRCKDLSERKLRLDLAKEAGVTPIRVRGLAGLSKSEIGSGEVVTVSFSEKDSAETAVRESAARYPGLRCSPKSTVRADKDGFYSVEFINSGMNGIREITTEFSKHGEVSKVTAGGSKNAVKRVTVSFAEKESAFAAVRAHANSKDFASLDFAKENVFEEESAERGANASAAAATS